MERASAGGAGVEGGGHIPFLDESESVEALDDRFGK